MEEFVNLLNIFDFGIFTCIHILLSNSVLHYSPVCLYICRCFILNRLRSFLVSLLLVDKSFHLPLQKLLFSKWKMLDNFERFGNRLFHIWLRWTFLHSESYLGCRLAFFSKSFVQSTVLAAIFTGLLVDGRDTFASCNQALLGSLFGPTIHGFRWFTLFAFALLTLKVLNVESLVDNASFDFGIGTLRLKTFIYSWHAHGAMSTLTNHSLVPLDEWGSLMWARRLLRELPSKFWWCWGAILFGLVQNRVLLRLNSFHSMFANYK